MPWLIPLATAAYSIGSSAVQASKAKKSEIEAENQLNKTPKYKPNQSILNYYDEAIRKYNVSPTDTASYKRDNQNIKQGTVQALSSLNKLRSGSVANIIQGQNNALLNAAVKAENKKAQEFSVVGQATGMKAGEDAKAFQQNELYPFEAKYNLTTAKAAGERAAQRQGMQNFYNNANAAVSVLADGSSSDSWGTGKNIWGQSTRTVSGKSFTRPKYNNLNNEWMKNRSNYATY